MPFMFGSWFGASQGEAATDAPDSGASEAGGLLGTPPSGWFLSATIAVGVLVLVVGVAGIKSWSDLRVSQKRAAELRQGVRQVDESVERLKQRIFLLRSDSELLERVAREELGVVHPDEIVVILPDE